MASFETTFEIICGDCGGKLSATVSDGWKETYLITVEPCETCLKLKEDDTRDGLDLTHQKELDKLDEQLDELQSQIKEIHSNHPEILL